MNPRYRKGGPEIYVIKQSWLNRGLADHLWIGWAGTYPGDKKVAIPYGGNFTSSQNVYQLY